MHNIRDESSSINMRIVKRLVKLTCFIGIIFFLLFCITWQNIHMFTLNKKIEGLTQVRNDLEKSIYLEKMELSHLKSRERIRKIASEELGMVPVTYRDVKVIVY